MTIDTNYGAYNPLLYGGYGQNTSTYDTCRQLTYGMEGLSTDNTPINPFESLPMEIAFGTPLMVGAPIVMSKLGFGKALSVWQQMKSQPGQTWSQAWDMVTSRQAAQKQALSYLKNPNSRWQTFLNKNGYKNLESLSSEIVTPSSPSANLTGKNLTKYNNAVAKKHAYREAEQLIKQAKDQKMTGNQLKQQLVKIRQAMAKGDAKINEMIANGTIKKTSTLGKFTHSIKKGTGYYKLKGKLLSSTKMVKGATVGSRAAAGMRLASKAVKGTGAMAVLQGAFEVPAIIDAYKIDAKTGNKQLAKSGLKVGASAAGFAAGSALASAAIGAACGSVVPVIGNIVGFIGGLAVGALASWGAGKLWDKANGEGSFDKTETEIAQAKAADAKAQELSQTPEGRYQLLAEANEKLVDEEGNFLGDEQTLQAYEALLAEYQQEDVGEATPEYPQEYINPNQELINQFSSWG